MHLRRAHTLALLAALGPLGCEEPVPFQPPQEQEEPELVCPLPRLEEEETPLPAADPARVGTLPFMGDCQVAEKTVHRLNRDEYNNTVRDLLGVDLRPADDFPVDDSRHGFDNQADALSVAPVLVEQYHRAARALVDAALDRGLPEVTARLIEAEEQFGGPPAMSTHAIANENGARRLTLFFDHEGTYFVRVRAFGEQAGAGFPELEIEVDGESAAAFDVEATAAEPGLYEMQARLSPGPHTFVFRYNNDYYRAERGGDPELDRNLVLDFIEIEGPYDPVPGPTPAARQALLTCDPEEVGDTACAEEILTRFVTRAFRRPAAPDYVARLTGFVTLARAEGQDFEHGLKLALRAVLLSPSFLYRVEPDEAPDDDTPRLVDDWALASRLSYFLWSSMPDERLFTLAEEGALQDPVVLEAEVRRMLRDEKSRALVESFGGQWLGTRAVDNVVLDPELYPKFDPNLAASMRCETELYFNDLLRNGGTVEDVLTGGFTYVNKRLARHYDLPVPEEEPAPDAHPLSVFERVPLEDSERVGLLTQGGVLALGGHPDRTSPVKRGKWALEQLLCISPPPPPPGVEGLIEANADAQTVRERLEQHRADPACAGCHTLMDPIGLGLENFAADGSWREEDNGQPIDASAVYMGVDHFEGARELSHLLADDDNLAACAVKKVMTWGLGRSLAYDDNCAKNHIRDAFTEGGHKLEDLFVLVATSAPFRMRGAAPEAVEVTPDEEGADDEAPPGEGDDTEGDP